MIVRFRKKLIQKGFLERHYAQNLKKSVERDRQVQFLLDDRNENVNRNNHPDLCFHGVLGGLIKRFDPKVLLDPTEEEIHLPAEFVKLGDRQRRQMKVVGQKGQVPIVLPVVESNPSDDIGIIGLGFDAGQNDFLVAGQVEGFVDGLRRDPSRLEIRLGADDEKGAVLMAGVESREVQISSIQNKEGPRLDREFVEDTNIVYYSFCNMDISW